MVWVLGACKKLRQVTISFVVSLYLSVRPSVCMYVRGLEL